MAEELKNKVSETEEMSGVVDIEVASPDGQVEEISASVESDPVLEWYILKVQSNREDSVKRNLEKRIRMAGLERYFGHIILRKVLLRSKVVSVRW